MQEQDVVSKEYFEEDARIADFINGYFFKGKQVVSAKDVREADSAVFGRVRWFGRWTGRQRYRDIVRRVLLGIRFAMVGIEEQGLIHFAMPVRAMGYDFLSYDRQVKRIKKRHSILKDLKGSAQFLSGVSSEDLLEPVVTVILYYGEEPWSGPKSLHDMLKLEDFPEDFRAMVNDYPLHIFEVNHFPHLDYFKTDLRLVFGFLQNRSHKERLKQFVRDNEQELSSLEDDACEMITVMSHSEELLRMKDKFRKGSKVDMCKALKEWMDESKLEGEDRFAGLTDRLLQDGRTEDLRRAASDKVHREQLYREFGL